MIFFQAEVIRAQTGPTISNITDNRATYTGSLIPKYEKLEINFSINNTVAKNLNFSYAPYVTSNPYPNANSFINLEQGITVDGQFLPPGETDWNKAYTQPAFYYQDYTVESHPTVNVGQDWYYPNGNFSWKIRFAPTNIGTVGQSWQYRIVATDASGTTTSPIQSFSITNPILSSSSSHGFVRVSKTDSRYFETEDGTYLPSMGYNMNYDHVNWVNPVAPVSYYSSTYNNNPDNFAKMGQNGIQLVRLWLSEWSIFGVGWNPWKAENGASNDPPWNWLDLESGTNPASEFAVLVGPDNRCMIYGLNTYHPAVKPNTTYRFRLNYALQGFTGSGTYGLAVRLSSDTSNCGNNGNLISSANILPSYPKAATSSWQIIDGTYTTKAGEYFLPYIFVAADNITGGWGSFRSLEIQEVIGTNQYGANILPKYNMDHHLYFDQRQSFAFDKVVELAKTNGVYLRPVILDHREETLNTLDTVYGNYDYSMSRGRWLETQWYRYLQARWGYSTAIHSWEFVNEGDPGNSHVYGADYLGRYMHGHLSSGTFDAAKYFANWHLSATSVWTGSTADWNLNNFPDIDFADFHQYIIKAEDSTKFYDTALATYDYSIYNTGAGRPVIRGETGLTDVGTQPGTQDISSDTNAIWLHNFVWGGINYGGLIESYWYESYPYGHIYTNSYDHRDQYGNFYKFIKNIPLSNGHYVDAGATVPANVRVWGQKDLANKRAHLWIANANYRWNNKTPAVVSGNISISGFGNNTTYKIEYWDTYTGTVKSGMPTTITANASGVISINTATFFPSGLVTDFAVKIGDYSSVNPTPNPSPSIIPTPSPSYSVTDLKTLINKWLGIDTGYYFPDGKVNALDAAWVIKWLVH